MVFPRVIPLIFILFLFFGCSSSYTKSAHIANNHNICKTQTHCNKKTKAECAVSLYLESKNLFLQAEIISNKKLYLSARIYLAKALCCLRSAEGKMEIAKLDNYQDYQIVMRFDLDKKIKEHINNCESFLRRIRWK